ELRFNIDLLAERLVMAIDELDRHPATRGMRVGLFGASTGAAAALKAAAARPDRVGAMVSRGGRPDLGGEALSSVRTPTLLIVGSNDREVLNLNRQAAQLLTSLPLAEVKTEIVHGAGHLFEEPGALEKVADLAAKWFRTHLGAGVERPTGPYAARVKPPQPPRRPPMGPPRGWHPGRTAGMPTAVQRGNRRQMGCGMKRASANTHRRIGGTHTVRRLSTNARTVASATWSGVLDQGAGLMP